MSSRNLIRLGLNLTVLALFFAHAAGINRLPVIEKLENIAYDGRLVWTMPNTQIDDVIIADIDEKSLEAFGHFPWRRNVLANLMDTLFDYYGVTVVGFDIVFPEKDESGGLDILRQLSQEQLKDNQQYLSVFQSLEPELMYDRQFSESLKGRNVVLGYVFDTDKNLSVNILPNAIGEFDAEVVKKINIKHSNGYISNVEQLQKSVEHSGFFDTSFDKDGIARRVPVLQEYGGKLYPSLALETARVALGKPEIDFGLWSDGDAFVMQNFYLGDRLIPLDLEGNVLAPFRGGRGSFPYYSIADLYNKKIPKHLVENRVVLMGTSAAGLLDLRPTPVSEQYPGVEIHANIISGIMNGTIMTFPDYTLGLEVLAILVLGLIMILLQPKLSPGLNILLVAALLISICIINFYFWNKGYVLPIASELLVVVWLFLVHMSFGYLFEFRGKQVMAKQFGQYVPPEIVDELSDNPGELSLEGQSKELTVLFSDVRGFTSISEGLDAKELAELMNHYLTPMTKIIHEKRGTIDKYIGDAVMAFWGAPLEEPQHARLALEAGLEMLARLESLNAEFVKRNWPVISIGIGLNTGEMNVGNMGSDFRMAYTVMGDAVNLGARLEGLTKQYGVSMIVSEFTAAEVSDYVYLELDRVRVKGKQEPVTIYQPLCLKSELTEEQSKRLEEYQKGMLFYRKQEWGKAKEYFLALRETELDRPIYQIYLDRIAIFEKEVPTDNWDGVFEHLTK